MSEGHHRFIVDEQGEVVDRATPEQRQVEQAELSREMNNRAFRSWGHQNGFKVYRLGLFLMLIAFVCFMQAWYMRTTSISWLWGLGGVGLALVGLPIAVYGLRIM